MVSSIRTGTPLRQRMIDDMRMRKLEDKTQEAYIRAVRKLAAFLRRSPDTATREHRAEGSRRLCPCSLGR
jgi:integrase/recombinase XerD